MDQFTDKELDLIYQVCLCNTITLNRNLKEVSFPEIVEAFKQKIEEVSALGRKANNMISENFYEQKEVEN